MILPIGTLGPMNLLVSLFDSSLLTHFRFYSVFWITDLFWRLDLIKRQKPSLSTPLLSKMYAGNLQRINMEVHVFVLMKTFGRLDQNIVLFFGLLQSWVVKRHYWCTDFWRGTDKDRIKRLMRLKTKKLFQLAFGLRESNFFF